MKPGGHGAIWKLARDEGIFELVPKIGEKKKLLIRQINNPLAGLDHGFLTFCGIGIGQNKVFGFASCPRLIGSAEGVNVLVEDKKTQELALTNVEFCDFAKFGIRDAPLKPNEPYSRFSSNTNILFADLKALSQAVKRCPYPGLLINLKKIAYVTEAGERREEKLARLESTMQNIADAFVEKKGRSQNGAYVCDLQPSPQNDLDGQKGLSPWGAFARNARAVFLRSPQRCPGSCCRRAVVGSWLNGAHYEEYLVSGARYSAALSSGAWTPVSHHCPETARRADGARR